MFSAYLIKIEPIQSESAQNFLKQNCTYVKNFCYIYEGVLGCLDDSGVKYKKIASGATPVLGDMTTAELINVCDYAFKVGVTGLDGCCMKPLRELLNQDKPGKINM